MTRRVATAPWMAPESDGIFRRQNPSPPRMARRHHRHGHRRGPPRGHRHPTQPHHRRPHHQPIYTKVPPTPCESGFTLMIYRPGSYTPCTPTMGPDIPRDAGQEPLLPAPPVAVAPAEPPPPAVAPAEEIPPVADPPGGTDPPPPGDDVPCVCPSAPLRPPGDDLGCACPSSVPNASDRNPSLREQWDALWAASEFLLSDPSVNLLISAVCGDVQASSLAGVEASACLIAKWKSKNWLPGKDYFVAYSIGVGWAYPPSASINLTGLITNAPEVYDLAGYSACVGLSFYAKFGGTATFCAGMRATNASWAFNNVWTITPGIGLGTPGPGAGISLMNTTVRGPMWLPLFVPPPPL